MPLTPLRTLFLGALLIAILPLGSVRPGNLFFSAACQALLFGAILALTPWPTSLRRPLCMLLGIGGLAGLYTFAQTLWFAGNPLAHPAFALAGRELGVAGGSISLSPGDTLRSLPSLVSPFFAFGTALLLSRSDVQGYRTWRMLAGLGAAFALFGLVRLSVFPQARLFAQEHLSTGVMTGTFVNQNNAATFLGLSALSMLGLLSWQVARSDRGRLLRDVRRPGLDGLGRQWPLLLSLLALLAIVLGLFLTRSRAGIALSAAALVAGTLATIATLPYRAATPRRKAAGMVLAIGVALAGIAVLGQRTVLRAELAGPESIRECLYRDVLSAIGDSPLLGTGLGTFERIYPMVRSTVCGLYGNPERAHNSYLEGYLGLGLPFAVLLLACLACLGWIYAAGLRERRRLRFVPILALAALALLLAHSAVDFPIQIHGIAIYFAALLGTAAGVSLAHPRG
jgi:O-antigen ligase